MGRLGEAIFEAYSQAQAKRGAAAALAAMRQGDGGGPDEGPAEPYDPGMPDIHDPRWLGWVWQSLDEAGLRVDEMLAGGRGDAAAERTVPGPNGYVRVRAVGQGVTAVLVDAPGVAERNPDAVAGGVCSFESRHPAVRAPPTIAVVKHTTPPIRPHMVARTRRL